MHGFPDDWRIYQRTILLLAPRRVLVFDWVESGNFRCTHRRFGLKPGKPGSLTFGRPPFETVHLTGRGGRGDPGTPCVGRDFVVLCYAGS